MIKRVHHDALSTRDTQASNPFKKNQVTEVNKLMKQFKLPNEIHKEKRTHEGSNSKFVLPSKDCIKDIR